MFDIMMQHKHFFIVLQCPVDLAFGHYVIPDG
jgi:hypothetical protein